MVTNGNDTQRQKQAGLYLNGTNAEKFRKFVSNFISIFATTLY